MFSVKCYKCGYIGLQNEMPAIIYSNKKVYICGDSRGCKERVNLKIAEEKHRAEKDVLEAKNEFLEKFGDDIFSRLYSLPRMRDAREHYYDWKTGQILSCHINAPKHELKIHSDAERLRAVYAGYITELTTGVVDKSKREGHPREVLGLNYKELMEYVKMHKLDYEVDDYNNKRFGGAKEDIYEPSLLYVELKGAYISDGNIPDDAIVSNAYGCDADTL